MQAVLLPVGADLYALSVDWVREVVASPTVTALVTAPPAVLGLFNVRGEIVPLWDTAALMGVGQVDKRPYAVVLRTERGLAGLSVTAFPERVLLDSLSGPSELPGTLGAYRVGERVAVLIDPDIVLGPGRSGEPDERGSLPRGGVA
jgi:chemotaxis signal transduction protein